MLMCDWDHEPRAKGVNGDVRCTVIGPGPDFIHCGNHPTSLI